MTTLAIRIIAAIVWKLGWKAAFIAHKEWMAYYAEQQALLTPQEKTEWNQDWARDINEHLKDKV